MYTVVLCMLMLYTCCLCRLSLIKVCGGEELLALTLETPEDIEAWDVNAAVKV